ncbi:hydroxymethylglutaryl-CoA synthase [Caviibacter abscessus]|uniref:hydroxymethylglutaryl-CoA synthase n=1 Tax=Caviibacter abscessus TaxID=1766719 RepID=UPI000832CF0E|nr:hydroxymethylglutaryl-CoA synthase [Caviibacter abscessus]
MKIGIDRIGAYIPSLYLDIADLAESRGIDKNKFLIGLGQEKMAIAPVTQDIVTLGAMASLQILDDDTKEKIDMIIVGTETGLDHSKSSAVQIKEILGINDYCRCFEIKQACYGATAGLQLAYDHILRNPESKVLIVASDIAKYGVKSSGESTQGAGAVAMLISSSPRILDIETDGVYYTKDIDDFFRPNNECYPVVNGALSKDVYLDFLCKVYERYSKKYDKNIDDFSAICFHIPYPKLGYKGLKLIAPENKKLDDEFHNSIIYNKKVGNIYTGSMFLNFLSLIENSKTLKPNDRIGFYSYGSGAVAEFFSGTLVEGYEKVLNKNYHQNLLNNRRKITIEEYENIFFEKVENGILYENKYNDNIWFKGVFDNVRKYGKK